MVLMEVTVLHNELNLFSEPESGFCLFIKFFSKKILFDISYSNDFILNAKKAKIELNFMDYLLFSHGHLDHTIGLKYFDISKVKEVIAHPCCFEKKFFEGEGDIGSPFSTKEIKEKTKLTLVANPYWFIPKKAVFLGEIPRKTDFEKNQSIGYLANKAPDFVKDDSAIVFKTRHGLVILTGCSHSGVCNIIMQAIEVCNDSRVLAVIGGFHLFDKNQIDKTIEFFKKRNIKQIYPMHCLNEYAFREFEKIGAKRLFALDKVEFNE